MQRTRRRLLIATGAMASGGIFAVSQATQTDAQTEIQMESFSVPDTEESVKEISKVPINVTVRAEWDSTGATDLEITLFAGQQQSTATDLTTETFTIDETGENTFDVSGDVLEASDISKSMLDPTISPSVLLSIGIKTKLKADGETLDSSELWDTAELTVNDDVVEGSLTAGGVGEIRVE